MLEHTLPHRRRRNQDFTKLASKRISGVFSHFVAWLRDAINHCQRRSCSRSLLTNRRNFIFSSFIEHKINSLRNRVKQSEYYLLFYFDINRVIIILRLRYLFDYCSSVWAPYRKGDIRY